MDAVKRLIQRSQKQDMAAFEQLVQMYQQKVYSLSYQLTGNHADAQDLAQEVFIRAYSAIKKFRQEADFGTWLHRIAVNTWINKQKKENRVQVLPLDSPVQTDEGEMQREIADENSDPLAKVEEGELRSFVRAALYELSYEHRAVLVLREIEGYSYEEIAWALGCSIGTVRSRLNRARQAMRKAVARLAEREGR